jgi:hypothetical protein
MNAKPLFFSPRCGLGAVAIFPLPCATLVFLHPRLPESIWLVWAGVTLTIVCMFVAGAWISARLKTSALVFCALAGVLLTVGQLSYIVHRSNEDLAQTMRDIEKQDRESKKMMDEVRKITEPNSYDPRKRRVTKRVALSHSSPANGPRLFRNGFIAALRAELTSLHRQLE